MPSSVAKYCHDPIPESEIKRFQDLELRYQKNPAVEGQLRKLAEKLRARLLPAFKAWVYNSNTKGRDAVDRPLVEICVLLDKAITLPDLLVAVSMTIHAQHTKGIFLGEMVRLKGKESLKDIGIDLNDFRDPHLVEMKSGRQWDRENKSSWY